MSRDLFPKKYNSGLLSDMKDVFFPPFVLVIVLVVALGAAILKYFDIF
jgi:hypothetical protein